MRLRLARYRKALATGAGAFLLVAAQVQPLVHGAALHWLSVAVALATVVTTAAVRNAPAAADGIGWPGTGVRRVRPAGRRSESSGT